MYLQLHDFPEVAHISFHYESERATVYSPADARVTGGHSEETRATLHIHSLFNRGHVSHKGFTCHLCSHDAKSLQETDLITQFLTPPLETEN